jgi:AraC family transcriptional regulator
MFEAYLNNPREVPPNELITEICLPLQPAVGAAA